MKSMKGKPQQNKNLKTSLVVFCVVLLLILGIYFYVKDLMPNQMFVQGKKYMAVGQYDKALKMFKIVADVQPYDTEPIYYQALAISKLPPTFENQKQLYEIAQLEDCDEASQLAETILMNMRKQLDAQVGSNYIDNVLFEDSLIRWNISQPITYSIFSGSVVPRENIEAVKKAFFDWQAVTNGVIKFKETAGNKNANIVVNFMDDISLKDKYEPNRVGKAIPSISNEQLQKMNIYLRKVDSKGMDYNKDEFYTVALHEIGHALGLGGHSADSKDVMYYNGDYIDETTIKKDITKRDMNTLNLLYRMVPDIIDKPLDPNEYNNLFYHEILTTYPGENFELETKRLLAELEKDRKNIIVWVDLAINYAFKKQYARSNYVLYNVLPLVQTDLQNQHVILYNLAVNYYKMRDYSNSSRYLSMAENLKSDLDTQILQTFLDVRFGRLELAKKKLNILIDQYPDNIEVALKLAEVYHIQKNRKMEKEVIDSLIKRNPKALKDRRVLKYTAKNNLKGRN